MQVGTAHAFAQVPPALRTAPGGSLLVIDSDAGNRDLLRRDLERLGYTVEQAEDSVEALHLSRSQSFQAVLLDASVAGNNRLDVLDRLKQDSDLGDTPVLAIFASHDRAAIAQFIRHGAEDYLLKPLDPVLLDARLSLAVDRNRLRASERLKSAELERLSSELKRSHEDVRAFAYAASHDLQAPVRTITAYIQLLQRRLKARIGDDEREMFAFAEGAAKRMQGLIRGLLEYSQAGTQEYRLESIASEDVVDALLLDMDGVIQDAGAQVGRDQLPLIVYDPARLRQVLHNLIRNAITYRRPDQPPRVHVSAVTGDGQWQFTIRDNGEGVAAEHVERIFELLHRLHGHEMPGSGIGLALCKRIVERSGGKIWVESEVGRGSLFCFTIPFPAPSAP